LQHDRHIMNGTELDERIRRELKLLRDQGVDPPRELYYRDPDITWTFIEVTNTGRRKIRIDKVGYVTDQHTYRMVIDFLPTDIEEGRRVDQQVDEEKMRNVNVIGAFAVDSQGRSWYGNVVGVGNRLKAFLGLKPFPR
jgi:hypothetical protein